MSQQGLKVKLDVKGMHCAACSTRIERVLAKKEFINTIQVNLANNIAEVELAQGEKETLLVETIGAIKKLGFDASESVDPIAEFESKKTQL